MDDYFRDRTVLSVLKNAAVHAWAMRVGTKYGRYKIEGSMVYKLDLRGVLCPRRDKNWDSCRAEQHG